ncbi:K02A2.6-like, partial [Cordylochernes scorpioides]
MFSHVTRRSVTVPAQIQPPETFDFSTPNEWPKWRKIFERYLVVSGMKKKEEADKIDLFMYLMGDRADDIFRTFKFEKEEEATKIDSVLKAFDNHFCVRKNIIYERAKFNSRIQEDREPVDEFITSLYKLADSCEFEGFHEQLIRDRIVVGVRDKALSERMQLDSELTLEKVVEMVRQQEAVRQQQVDLQRPSTSQKVNQVSAVEDSSNLDDDEGECRRRWTAEIQVNGKQVKFKLDSQADVTCVPLCLFKKIMGQQRLVESDINIRAAEFSELQTVGMFISTLRNGNYEIKEKIYVIRRLSEPLLSRRACELLNLARRIEVVATRINPIKEFPEVFEGLGQIGNPYEIKLKPGAKPYAVHTPRRVPIPLMEKLKTRLEELEKAGIIAQVNVATEWCAPTVIAGKPNGDIRLCVDLSRLNEHVQREVHPMPVVEHMLGQLGEARFFSNSKLDANSGFHQIPLSPDCQHLTTFITPFGRYKYCRMPFGISLAPEYFQKVMSIILQGMDGVMCYLDDILIFASDSKTHDRILRLVLRKLKEAKVTLNKAKCVFGVSRINFLGHILDEDGIRPDPAKIEAVAKMPAPTDVHGVRRFLGMVNHLGRFVENLSEIVAPLNQLLVKGQDFVWDCSQERAFRKLKELLTTQPILAAYDVRKPTMVSSDASSYGLGTVLKQEGKNGIWRPVAYSSRTMTPTEKRYAQIEKEALAITWACERFQDFLLGKRFRIETDHKPLIPLFSTKELSSLTPRLQLFRMRMMRFGFEIVHIPGKELLDADALSRQPLLTTEGGEDERPISAHINAVLSSITDKDEMLTKIFEAQQEDTTLKAVVNYLEQGWPDKKKMSQALLSYWHVKDELGVQNGLLMRSCRLVIPASMKLEILDKLHAGHFGITKTRLRARETLDRLTANVVVRSCKSIFARHGIPETVVSDNGTQFGNFARQYGFTHVTSSPRFPQSNGMAEAGVKIAKLILKKNQDPSLGLLEYRPTPLENGYSPAELLMGRKLRTTLPIAPENLNPRLVDSQTLKRKEGRRRKDMKSRYDRRCGATDMEELSEGDTVWITDMRIWGIVKQKASTPRSYMVDTPVGTLRRNRFHLRKGDTVQYPADPSTPTFSGEELVENEKTPVVDYPSNDSEDGQIRIRSGRIVKPGGETHARGRRKIRSESRRTKLRGVLQASCCLKRSDCCLPPTPVYFLEDSRRFYELLSPVLLLLSLTVLQKMEEILKAIQAQNQDLQAQNQETREVFKAQNQELKESLGLKFKCLEDQISSVKEEMKEEISSVKEEMKGEMKDEISSVKEEMASLKERLAAVETGHPRSPVFQQENNNSGRLLVKVPTFDGQSSWTSFKTQFDVVAQANGWNVRDKASFLAAALRGPAVEVLQMIPEQLRLDFNALIDALESRYGEEHYQQLHVVKFKNRLQEKKESLQDLANDIRRLARLAFPTCPSETQDFMAQQQFIDAIGDPETQKFARLSSATTLQETLVQAMKHEAAQQASRGSYRLARQVKLDNPEREKGRCWTCGANDHLSRTCPRKVKQRSDPGCWKCGKHGHIRKNCQDNSKDKSERKRGRCWTCGAHDHISLTCPRKVKPRSDTDCWSCGQYGHMRRNCPENSETTTAPRKNHGRRNDNADALSRRPCVPQSGHCARAEERFCVRQVTVQESDEVEEKNWTDQAIRKAQREDRDLLPMINWKESGERPSWEDVAQYSPETKSLWRLWNSLTLRDGVLYRKWESEDGKHESWKLVLPRSHVPLALQEMHSSPTGDHFGISKTLAKVRERFCWPGSRTDVEKWCRNCTRCSVRKGPTPRSKERVKIYNVGAPFERMPAVHQWARENLHFPSEKMKDRYNVKTSNKTFKEGEMVWLHNPQRKKGLSPKLQYQWKGPFKIIKCLNDVIFRIQKTPTSKPKVVHYNRLAPFSGTVPVQWTVRDDQRELNPTRPGGRVGTSDMGVTVSCEHLTGCHQQCV